MEKIIITVLTQDRPGIMAAVSEAIFKAEGNLEQVSQTLLATQFAGIFIAAFPPDTCLEELKKQLDLSLKSQKMEVMLRHMPKEEEYKADPSEPFIITCFGPDRRGLVAEISSILASHKVNITKLKAVFEGEKTPSRNLMIYETDIPSSTDISLLSRRLKEKAEKLKLVINIQHRKIFESITRI